MFVSVFLLIDDPSSEENGECFTRKYEIDLCAWISNDQRRRFSLSIVHNLHSDKNGNFTILQAQPSTFE